MKFTNLIAKVVLPICSATLLGGAAWVFAFQNSARAKTGSDQQEPNWHRVDRAARSIGAGDETAIRSLVNEVLAENGIGEKIVATAGSVPDRLVAAELAYQKSADRGVAEERVVDAVNQLAQRFNAPRYAYTDVDELRKLRLRMLTVYPGLIGRGSAATRDDFNPHFDRSMSPVEAFHVTATLVFQKLVNPEFQFSRAEERDAVTQRNSTNTAELKQKVATGERTQELLGIVRQSTASMSLRDMLDLSEQTLDRLGIPR